MWHLVHQNKVKHWKKIDSTRSLSNHHVVNVLRATVRSSKILNNYKDRQNTMFP